MANVALRRLMSEYRQLTVCPPEGIVAGPPDEENFFLWEVRYLLELVIFLIATNPLIFFFFFFLTGRPSRTRGDRLRGRRLQRNAHLPARLPAAAAGDALHLGHVPPEHLPRWNRLREHSPSARRGRLRLRGPHRPLVADEDRREGSSLGGAPSRRAES